MVVSYILYIVLGFASGSILWCRMLPRWLRGVDIVEASEDGNPGTTNAVKYAGAPIGMLCLVMELLKGFVPVCLAAHYLNVASPAFAGIMFAPAAGHAFSPMLRGRGGKAVAVSFGTLLGIVTINLEVFVLAGLLIVARFLPIHPDERRTVSAFMAFAVIQWFLGATLAIRAGVTLMAALVVVKNWRDAKKPVKI